MMLLIGITAVSNGRKFWNLHNVTYQHSNGMDEPTPPPQQKIILQPPVGMIFMTVQGIDRTYLRLE
jgi:hypothetical protein